MTQTETALQPMPGDAVRLDGYYGGVKTGAIAIIDSGYFEPGVEAMICFGASAYRGPLTGIGSILEAKIMESKPTREREDVSCSGGPLPFVKIPDLEPAGEYAATFWKWNRWGPGAGNGERYTLTVPLWSWKGERR